jgi:hypothetical protein
MTNWTDERESPPEERTVSLNVVAEETVAGTTWSPLEVESAVATYFQMLQLELAGTPYVKKHFIRREIEVAGRSRGSVEFKFQNISAVLLKRGLPYVDGYKPSANFQTILAEAVDRRLVTDFEHLTSPREAALPPIMPVIVPAPFVARDGGKPARNTPPRLVDWTAIENGRRQLGRVGEAYIVDFERNRLASVGRADLADKVIWVSDRTGDGDGYDIRSYSDQGDVLYIEVKTTIGGIGTPFFLTENEISVSQNLKEQYRLYRLFDFAKAPKLYILLGNLTSSCTLTPVAYSALPAVLPQ